MAKYVKIVEGLHAIVVGLLVSKAALRILKVALRTLKGGAEVRLVKLGNHLPLFDHTVVVHVNLVDYAAHLRTYGNLRYRLDGARCGNAGAECLAKGGLGVVSYALLLGTSCQEKGGCCEIVYGFHIMECYEIAVCPCGGGIQNSSGSPP